MAVRQRSLVIKVTVLDAQHNQIKDRVQRVTLSVFRTRQLHAHDVFNHAFDVNYPGPDGKALCATDHPLYPGAGSTEVQSNLITAPLSIDALDEARLKMLNFTDDRGKKLLLQPDTLIVPPALEKKAKEMLLSTERPDTADRATNVWKGAYRVVVLPLLTESDVWFLADSAELKRYLRWFERRKPVPSQDEDKDTETKSSKIGVSTQLRAA